ncbi:TIGR04282 family arsenosugar biosynthesis glycosyltransferase [Algoriphagus namhaensis]|uniref:TIGR04282 family arsenosugar biosynthesis glycosyltransferase n=1 Tax=Algoriphagus namhaensis TaxID=915353 RepID=A0ABV8AT13_9BACT
MSLSLSNNSTLLIFQKNIVLGQAKTRIAATVGDEKALEIYQKLIAYTHTTVSALPMEKYLYFSEVVEQEYVGPNQFHLTVQKGLDLGERMANAFQNAFDAGYSRVILIGTDCGELSSEILEKAFECLNSADLVLGPAKDGGYYLIGMTGPHSELFSDMEWSTADVLERTLEKAQRIKLEFKLLPLLSDVDTYSDWMQQKNHVESVLKQG